MGERKNDPLAEGKRLCDEEDVAAALDLAQASCQGVDRIVFVQGIALLLGRMVKAAEVSVEQIRRAVDAVLPDPSAHSLDIESQRNKDLDAIAGAFDALSRRISTLERNEAKK